MIEITTPGVTAKFAMHGEVAGEWPVKGTYGSLYLVARDKICERCNNGWMSRLQTAAMPAIGNMIAGRRIILAEDAQTAACAWTTMLGMVLDCVRSDKSTWFYTERERSRLRTDGEIPAVSTCWFGYLDQKWGHLERVAFARGATFDFLNAKAPSFLRVPSFINTMAIFHGVFQLLVYRMPAGRADAEFFKKRDIEDPWADYTIRCGPPQGPLEWPPPARMDRLQLFAFSQRWQGPTGGTPTKKPPEKRA